MTAAKARASFVTDKAIALIKALHGTPIGAKEFSGGWCPERCDAILFNSGSSFLIETKISRSDFLADFKKPHRIEGGVGNYRYYACPEGLIKPEELPPKWGLIYVQEAKNRRAKMPVGFGGSIRTPSKDYKHPDPNKGWTIQTYESFGSDTPEHIKQLDDFWKHPEYPRKWFRFPNPDFEREFLFALATRYKSQAFMNNIL